MLKKTFQFSPERNPFLVEISPSLTENLTYGLDFSVLVSKILKISERKVIVKDLHDCDLLISVSTQTSFYAVRLSVL